MKKFQKVFLLFLLHPTLQNTCEILNCKICCNQNVSNGTFYCSKNELDCKLKVFTDFDHLQNFLLFLIMVIFGIPGFAFLMNLCVIKRMAYFNISFFEMFVNTVFCVWCYKMKKSESKSYKSERNVLKESWFNKQEKFMFDKRK